MIRALQKDNRVTKAIFAVIIGVATLSMVLYLVPGLYDGVVGASTPPGVYATVKSPGVFGRLFGETTDIKTTEVTQLAQSLAQRQNLPAQYLPFLMPRFEQQAQQVLVASAIETREAARLGLTATDADVQAGVADRPARPVLLSGRQVHRRRQVQGLCHQPTPVRQRCRVRRQGQRRDHDSPPAAVRNGRRDGSAITRCASLFASRARRSSSITR